MKAQGAGGGGGKGKINCLGPPFSCKERKAKKRKINRHTALPTLDQARLKQGGGEKTRFGQGFKAKRGKEEKSYHRIFPESQREHGQRRRALSSTVFPSTRRRKSKNVEEESKDYLDTSNKEGDALSVESPGRLRLAQEARK